MPRSLFLTIAAAGAIAMPLYAPAIAYIPTCQIHSGMTVWFIDYAESDYTSQRPLGVLKGVVDINESKWRKKCGADGPATKIFVPFNYVKNGKREWDTRWPQDVYRTRREAEAAFQARFHAR